MALRKPERATTPALNYYYDTHPTHEDLMGESTFQSELIHYLVEVMLWLYRVEKWFVVSNLNIYRSRDYMEYPLAPDVAVFKGVKPPRTGVRSWKMLLPDRPAPTVVFEVCSEETVTDDMEEKPDKYGRLGVREYFAYDPHEPVLRKKYGARIYGWRYETDGQPQRIEPDEQGRLWSEELESWLVPDGRFLRLYDETGNLRLTATEAEQEAKEKAWAKLRELGIDPEKL